MKYHIAGTFTGSITQLTDDGPDPSRINPGGFLDRDTAQAVEQQNAARIREWGEPGSKVRDRVTERADAKAAEEKRLAEDIAHFARTAGMFGGAKNAAAQFFAPRCSSFQNVLALLKKHGVEL